MALIIDDVPIEEWAHFVERATGKSLEVGSISEVVWRSGHSKQAWSKGQGLESSTKEDGRDRTPFIARV
jgi:hypothetical protein